MHPHLAAPLPDVDRCSLAGLQPELDHTAVSFLQARMALSYPGGQTQSVALIPQRGFWSLKWCVGVCMHDCITICIFVGVD